MRMPSIQGRCLTLRGTWIGPRSSSKNIGGHTTTTTQELRCTSRRHRRPCVCGRILREKSIYLEGPQRDQEGRGGQEEETKVEVEEEEEGLFKAKTGGFY
jgi:hypothetical protein